MYEYNMGGEAWGQVGRPPNQAKHMARYGLRQEVLYALLDEAEDTEEHVPRLPHQKLGLSDLVHLLPD